MEERIQPPKRADKYLGTENAWHSLWPADACLRLLVLLFLIAAETVAFGARVPVIVTPAPRGESCASEKPTCLQVAAYDDATKAALLRTFAPRIWMAPRETCWASSVEWALPHLTRQYRSDAKAYCLQTIQPLRSPTSKLEFFQGDQSGAVLYAFWVEKDPGIVDLSYWQYCPYNLGKVVLGSEFGDHVSDWEHVTVRLEKLTRGGLNYLKPVKVAFSAHYFCNLYSWDSVRTIGATHVVAYCAKGSHGMWKEPGKHVYKNLVLARLADECGEGTAWDTWNCLHCFEYSPKTSHGRGLGAQDWPAYFNSDYSAENGGGAWYWGNAASRKFLGRPRLDHGPRGPEAHAALQSLSVLD